MNVEELKSKVVFRSEPHWQGTKLVGILDVRSSMVIVEGYLNDEAVKFSKEQIREGIAREIYNDQRSAMCQAINDLYMCLPNDWRAHMRACDKIAALAKYQPNL